MKEDLKIKAFDGIFAAYVSAQVITLSPIVIVSQKIFGVNLPWPFSRSI